MHTHTEENVHEYGVVVETETWIGGGRERERIIYSSLPKHSPSPIMHSPYSLEENQTDR